MKTLGFAMFENGKGVSERFDNGNSERHQSGGQRDRAEIVDGKIPHNVIDRLVAHLCIVSPARPFSANDPAGMA